MQIKLAKMFDAMRTDFLDGSAPGVVEDYFDVSALTEEFEATQEDIDESELECEPGDALRRLNDDGHAVIALAGEANKQEQEKK